MLMVQVKDFNMVYSDLNEAEAFLQAISVFKLKANKGCGATTNQRVTNYSEETCKFCHLNNTKLEHIKYDILVEAFLQATLILKLKINVDSSPCGDQVNPPSKTFKTTNEKQSRFVEDFIETTNDDINKDNNKTALASDDIKESNASETTPPASSHTDDSTEYVYRSFDDGNIVNTTLVSAGNVKSKVFNAPSPSVSNYSSSSESSDSEITSDQDQEENILININGNQKTQNRLSTKSESEPAHQKNDERVIENDEKQNNAKNNCSGTKQDTESDSCGICNKRFRLQIARKRHMETHDQTKSKWLKSLEKYSKGNFVYSTSIPTPLKCSGCSHEFTSKYRLELHEKTDTCKVKLTCSVCNTSFTDALSLRSHADQHFSDRVYQCNMCEKDFNDNEILKQHIDADHTAEEKHNVDAEFSHCEISIGSDSTLNKENKLSCRFCSQLFEEKSILEIHVNSHLNTKINEKQFACGICDKSFTQERRLRAHQSIHNDPASLLCDVCKKEFYTNERLGEHKRKVHSGKTYACTECTKIFKSSSSLYRHKKNHHKM